MALYTAQELHAHTVAVCLALGSEPTEAALVADQLVEANRCGHDSHGVGMLPTYVALALAGQLKINAHCQVVNDAGPLLVLDGQQGFGQVMGAEAMAMAIERAQRHGVALVGLRDSFHIGRIGHWGEQLAAAGLVSVHFVNVAGHHPTVAPYGAAQARLLTNPVCISIPGRDGRPALLLDMATSRIALGKARVAMNMGVAAPEGSIVDGDGLLSDDPTQVFGDPPRGALVAMGEHKGSGLAIMCELLGAALFGGTTICDQSGPPRVLNSMMTIAIDPNATGSAESLLADTDRLIEWITSARPRQGVSAVLVPGQPEQAAREARAHGIEVDAATVAQLNAAAEAAQCDSRLREPMIGER